MSSGNSDLENQVVVFTLEEQNYALPVSNVLEIIRSKKVTRLPNIPEFIEGIIEIRGQVIPVMDLRKRFGLAEGEETASTRIILVRADGNTMGLVVDSVTEVLHVSEGSVKPPPASVQIDRSFIHGIALMDDRMIILLDMNMVLVEGEKDELESFMEAEQPGGAQNAPAENQ